MARHNTTGLITALSILITVECLELTLDDVDSSQQADDIEAAAEDMDRASIGPAYTIVTPNPGRQDSTPIKYINCHTCIVCEKNKPKPKLCPYSLSPKMDKKCISYAEKTKATGKINTHRGCVTDLGTCSKVRNMAKDNPASTVTYCTECTGNNCNAVSRTIFDLTTAVIVFIFVPVINKYIFI